MDRKKNILIVASNYYQDICNNLVEESQAVIYENW